MKSSQKPQGCTDNWICETATPSSHGGGGNIAELNLTISTGEGSERLHAQVLIFDKRSKIIAQCKSVLDRISAVLSFGAGLQTRPVHRWSLTAFFGGLLQLFPLNSEKLKRLCVLVEYMSKSGSCFVWKRIKRSEREVKIKREAEFSGPRLYNNDLKKKQWTESLSSL